MSEVFALGMLVEHATWGKGKVVEVDPPYVIVYFSSLVASNEGPRRKLRQDAKQLSLAAIQTDPDLDLIATGRAKGTSGRSVISKRQARPSVRPLDFAIAGFRARHPRLFEDPKLVDQELRAKRAAHDRFVARLGRGRGRNLLKSGLLGDVAAILDDLYHATKIPHRFEIMAAHDGFKDANAAGQVLQATFEFTESCGPNTFDRLAEAVSSLPTPPQGSRVFTWPNVTILPFLADPDRFMVMKPTIARRMADRMGFDLLYSATPRWHCYEALQRMSAQLLDELRPLGAKDYIDVQSFMWVTRGLE